MHDLKVSTLGEKILLSIIAAIMATIGFYLGYAKLSNGVNSLVIGFIVAIVFMVGGLAVSFILDEIIKMIFPKLREDRGYHATKAREASDATNDESPLDEDIAINDEPTKNNDEDAFFELDEVEEVLKTKKPIKHKIKRVSPFAKKKVETVTAATGEGIHEVEEATKEDDSNETIVESVFATEEVIKAKEDAAVQEENPVEEAPVFVLVDEFGDLKQDTNETMATVEVLEAKEESRRIISDIARAGRENAVNILVANGPVEETVSGDKTKEETQQEPHEELSLVDFIANNPSYPPRKMIRAYIDAGGQESTDNILDLMQR